MLKKTASLVSKLALAAVIVAGAADSAPISFTDAPLAGLSRSEALQMAQPSSDITDSAVINRPVLSGNNYQG